MTDEFAANLPGRAHEFLSGVHSGRCIIAPLRLRGTRCGSHAFPRMAPESSDPAGWSASSTTPDLSELDSLEDVLKEICCEELRNAGVRDAPKSLVELVTRVAWKGIARARSDGLLHDDESATFTPKFRELLARVIAEIIDAPNSKLHAQCLDFVFELGVQLGISQLEISEQHPPMTKSNVSKICVAICQRYGVRPSRGMKSEAARESYRVRQTGRRAKQSPEEWPYAERFMLTLYGRVA